ncbi:DMT family transporter [Vibrio fluvialis]
MFSGYLAMLATLLLWSGFFLSLREGAISALTPADIALTRFLIPAVVLLPFVMKAKAKIAVVPKRYLLGMFIGCGLPYLLLTGSAMHFVPVSDGSTLVPGTLPLFVSGIAVWLFNQPLSQHRIFGLVLVLGGIGVFLSTSAMDYQSDKLFGHLLFLLGSMMWAVFTICARVANLHSLAAAGFISLLSVVLLFALIATGVLPSYLAQTPVAQWPWQTLFGHSLIQGVGAGVIAAFTYLHAVTTLGAERSAAFGSATPAIATLLAIPVFGEIPTSMTWLGLGLVSCGSLIASNVFMKYDASLTYQPPQHGKG